MRNFAWLTNQLVREFGELLACVSAADPRGAVLHRTLPALELRVLNRLTQRRFAQGVIAAAQGISAEGLRRRRARLEERLQEESLVDEVIGLFRRSQRPLERIEVATSIYAAGARRHEQVFSVLRHLAQTGLLRLERSGGKMVYHRGPNFLAAAATEADVLLLCAQFGPLPLQELAELLELEIDECEALALPLMQAGLLTQNGGLLEAREAEVLFGDPSGFAAAIFDHVRAVCRALALKIDSGRRQARRDDIGGGATFSLLVPHDHPLRGEIRSFLADANERVRRWRESTRDFEPEDEPDRPYETITIYFGQMVERHEDRPGKSGLG